MNRSLLFQKHLIDTVRGGNLNHPGNLTHNTKLCVSFQPVNEIYLFFQLLFTYHLHDKSAKEINNINQFFADGRRKTSKNQCINKNITLRQSTKPNLFIFCKNVFKKGWMFIIPIFVKKKESREYIVIELESLFSLFPFFCVYNYQCKICNYINQTDSYSRWLCMSSEIKYAGKVNGASSLCLFW